MPGERSCESRPADVGHIRHRSATERVTKGISTDDCASKPMPPFWFEDQTTPMATAEGGSQEIAAAVPVMACRQMPCCRQERDSTKGASGRIRPRPTPPAHLQVKPLWCDRAWIVGLSKPREARRCSKGHEAVESIARNPTGLVSCPGRSSVPCPVTWLSLSAFERRARSCAGETASTGRSAVLEKSSRLSAWWFA